MIEKLSGMPTGCHISLSQEIAAGERTDRSCKRVIQHILIKLFHDKTKGIL
jgi:hypothetical protein